MPFGTSTVATQRRGAAPKEKKRQAPFRTQQSRRLVEEYWQSVLHSKVERPLYHTYSDRYGGTRGIPFASRTGGTCVVSGAARDAAGAPDRDVLFAECMEASERAMHSGNLSEARAHLRQALTQLQNCDGGLTVSALASTARGASASPSGQKRSSDTGEVLRRLGKMSLLCGDYAEALTFFGWSTEADPLGTETYALRAACLERIMEPQRAFAEYEKYLTLTPPTLEVLAHCGKCAAEAGNSTAAVTYLNQLLRETRSMMAQGDDTTRETAAFYDAHAHFYLGVVEQKNAEQEGRGGEVNDSALSFYTAAAENAAYVQSYENSADDAVEKGDLKFALHQLGCLQRMIPECADYYLRTAYVFHLEGNTPVEVDALSEALDRQQGLSARRTTLLTRGTVYADKVGDLERAIKDFTLVIGLPADVEGDRCTPVAFMKRAEVLRRRSALGGPSASEDQEAALRDYKQFLRALSSDGNDAQHAQQTGEPLHLSRCPSTLRADPPVLSEVFDESEICTSQSVTEALLILANGAFLKQDYEEATQCFSRAIARGWQPRPSQLNLSGGGGRDAPPSCLEGLYDQVYLSMAHHVIDAYPVQDDMFKVAYEHRDWSENGAATGASAVEAAGGNATATAGAAAAAKRAGGPASGARAADRKEAEKVCVPSPSLSYLLVDGRYSALRALEPAVFSALEEALLAVWGPYRAEVERAREDAMASKGGKRAKRHV